MANDTAQYIEVSVYELAHGGVAADPTAQLEGFRFGRPVKSFGPIPTELYAKLDELDALDAEEKGGARTAGTVDDLRYVWRRLGWAKEAECGSRQAPLTWSDDAATVSDADLEAVREVLEHHYPERFGALAEAA